MLRIKKLDIFILKQFGLLFIGTFFICQFVLMMQFLWKYVDDLIGKGLSMEVLAQFFWYMGLMLVPQALPLAILLSSLITFGNLGESSELTAIKAAGVSLIQAFRSLIVASVAICLMSFWFNDYVGPQANMKLTQLMISMKQKSPELEIPEGVFYDGIPQSNIYVQKKDMNTGKLYGIMIYRMTASYEDAAIILADSGMLQSTAEKKHLVMTLWSGEWFENMRSQDIAGSASVPYRRETFVSKKIVLDFDGDFSLSDASLTNNAKGKSLSEIRQSIDSLNHYYDSIGRSYYRYYMGNTLFIPHVGRADSLKTVAQGKHLNIDTIMAHATIDQRRSAVESALNTVQSSVSDLDFKSMMTTDGDKLIRNHEAEGIGKFTLALSCLLFFFIGAPLGAIIRKGGLGVPVIVAVLVFIIYFIFNNSGYRMARGGMWDMWFGMLLSTVVLTPMAVFVTYKSNNDSTVFNFDLYRNLFMRMFGLRLKRHVMMKEVIITPPDYASDAERLKRISHDIRLYSAEHKLHSLPNPITVFFRYHPDHEVERISNEIEEVIEELGNTRDQRIMAELNHYPVLAVKAHTRPFEHRWLNIMAGVILPLGIFFYMRMCRFRLRLSHDLTTITSTSDAICKRINELKDKQPTRHNIQ